MNIRFHVYCAFAFVALACSARAVSFNFTTIHSGDTPAGPSPYATLDVTQNGANNVKFTLYAGNLGASEFISFFKYNVTGSATAPAITPTILIGVGGTPTFGFSSSPANDAGLGFDAEVQFETSNSGGGVNRFKDEEVFVFNLARTGLLVSAIEVPMMIHIQGLANNGSSKVIGTLQSTPSPGVPDSGDSVALLGIALVATAFLRRKLA